MHGIINCTTSEFRFDLVQLPSMKKAMTLILKFSALTLRSNVTTLSDSLFTFPLTHPFSFFSSFGCCGVRETFLWSDLHKLSA